MWNVGQDARHGLRLLRREPGFALVAILTIALGVGATTTLFSVADGVLLKPLGWPESDRLVRITETRSGRPARIRGTITNGTYIAWHDQPSTVEAVAGYWTTDATAIAGGGGEPARIQIARVTPTLFPLLRARPLRGRLFEAEDASVGLTGVSVASSVVILSYGFWQQWYGGRDDAVGQALHIDGKTFTVIGVMPRDFAFPDAETRAWWPMPIGSVVSDEGGRRIQIFSALARLGPGVTPAQAAAEGTARARTAPDPGLAAVAMFGVRAPPDIAVTPAVEAMTADVRPAILVLLAAVGLLMATATANVASLQLARATTRRREMAVRAAIGAGAARLTRQLVVESSIIGGAGGLAGVLLAVALHHAMPSLLPADFPRVADIAIDLRVLGFAIAVSIAASVACGWLPAKEARRINLVEALAADGASSTGGAWRSRTGRVRAIIMAGQVAAACVLLVGAALLARSFTALMHADRGYDPANVLTARVDLPASYTAARRVAFADALAERLRAVPGVTHAAAGNALPFLNLGHTFGFGMPSPRDPAIRQEVQTMIRVVGPDYFQALRLRVGPGGPLTDGDTLNSRPDSVVNRTFARQYLGSTPLGARVPMSFGEGKPDCDVVGVVEDMRQSDVTEAQTPELFASYRQMPARLMNAPIVLVVRATGDPTALVPTLRAAVRERDQLLVVDSIMTMEERVLASLSKPRIYALLLSGFAVFALAIAGVGLFGVLSYGVAQRSREMGVRTALGAQPRDIVALVLRQAVMVAGTGVIAGLAMAVAVAKSLSAFLYGVTTYDAVSFIVVPIVLILVTAAACVVPARRAARADPLTALRSG